jgi:hypothetical protein
MGWEGLFFSMEMEMKMKLGLRHIISVYILVLFIVLYTCSPKITEPSQAQP